MKHLYFIRHGLSEMNKAGIWSGAQSQSPLSKEGRQQAQKAGIVAKQLGIDYIISSPLSRAHDTAKLIAREIGYPEAKIELNSLLIERDLGPLEGKPWNPDLNLDDIADVETADTIAERARLTLDHLQTLDAEAILVVSHGSFGRAFRHAVHPDIPFEVTPEAYRFPNGEIIKLL